MRLKKSSPWLFFTLTYGLSWLFWIPAALSGRVEPELPVLVLHYLGGLMLPLVAVGLVYLSRDRQVRLDYWQRVIDFRRIGAKWYAVILLTVPLLTTLAALLDLLLGGVGGGIEATVRSLPHPLMIIPFAVFILLFGPLPEELAWRGYVLDRLQVRQGPLVASLIIGVAWTLWHLPLFFIRGSYQHGLGIGSLSFWFFMSDKVPQSVLMTWIYNRTRRSTLSAVLFHFLINFVGELFDLTARAELFYILLWVATALVVIVVERPAMLAFQPEDSQTDPPM